MACQDVGSTNPDIAGLGIVIAFAFQAGLSLVLSFWSLSLWRSALSSLMTDIGPLLYSPYIFGFNARELLQQAVSDKSPESKARRLIEILMPDLKRFQDGDAIIPSSWTGVRWACKKRAIDKVLATISDVQILNALAILLAAITQYKSMSLYHLRIVYETASFTSVSVCASLVNVSSSKDEMKRTRAIPLALFVFAYISFFVIFCIQLGKWDESLPGHCYNTHFVASPLDPHPSSDYVYLGITCLYSLSALLSCYRSGAAFPFLARLFSRSSTTEILPTTSRATLQPSSSSVPPISENRFWARFCQVMNGKNFRCNDFSPLSGLVQFLRLLAIYFALLFHEKPEYRVWAIVPLAMAQYPLHLYMTIALRAGNESLLSGDSENSWGFGQIVAIILCAATLLECVRGAAEYRKIVQLQSYLEGNEVDQVQAVRTDGRRRNSYCYGQQWTLDHRSRSMHNRV